MVSSRALRFVLAGLTGILIATGVPSGQPAPAMAASDGPSLVHVHIEDDAALDRLRAGFDVTEARHGDHVDVVLWPGDAARLRAAGFEWDVAIADLEETARLQAIDDLRALQTQAVSPERETYRYLDDYEREMKALAERFPGHVRLLTGNHTTLEGRTVYAVELAANVANDDGRPTVLYDGLHHAREWPAAEIPMDFAVELAEGYGNDERITALLDRVRILVVPVVNPDGFASSRGSALHLRDDLDKNLCVVGEFCGDVYDGLVLLPTAAAASEGPYWRKNRRGVTEAPVTGQAVAPYGVDPNRNYAYRWGDGAFGIVFAGVKPSGASSYPTNAEYHGTSAFSEAETRNLRDFVLSRHVATALSHHTYSGLVLWPWGDTDERAPDAPRLEDLGKRMAKFNGYEPIQAIGLYKTTGTSEDWIYAATGALAFTVELGYSEFHPRYMPAVPYMYKVNRGAMLELAEAALDPTLTATLTGSVHDRITGAPVAATIRTTKTMETPTSLLREGVAGPPTIDVLDASIRVGPDGSFAWTVNASTRPIATAPESYTVTIAAPGYQPYTRTVSVVRGETLSLGAVRLIPA